MLFLIDTHIKLCYHKCKVSATGQNKCYGIRKRIVRSLKIRHAGAYFFKDVQMKPQNPFKTLTKFEVALWITSVTVITLSFVLAPQKDWLTLTASVLGVSSLIFIAKGNIFGPILCMIFATVYGVVSFFFKYYGELITYVCMTLPASAVSLVSWIRHPYSATQVKVSRLTAKKTVAVFVAAAALTVAFYFALNALDTPNIVFSTLSVTTSLIAASFTILRSPFYALAYSVNDVVLIVLWTLATVKDIAYLPMIMCFVMFLFNDLYGFFNWRRMQRKQATENKPQESQING